MSENLLLEVDSLLLERVRRYAKASGRTEREAIGHLLEHGLFACEAEMKARFDDSDADALKAAIAALESIQDDPGFSLIGRAKSDGAEAPVPAGRHAAG